MTTRWWVVAAVLGACGPAVNETGGSGALQASSDPAAQCARIIEAQRVCQPLTACEETRARALCGAYRQELRDAFERCGARGCDAGRCEVMPTFTAAPAVDRAMRAMCTACPSIAPGSTDVESCATRSEFGLSLRQSIAPFSDETLDAVTACVARLSAGPTCIAALQGCLQSSLPALSTRCNGS
jgi:hypothetical protein